MQRFISKHNLTFKLLGLNLIICFTVLFCLLMRLHFNNDSYLLQYSVKTLGYSYGPNILYAGRYTNFALRELQLGLGIDPVSSQHIFIVVMIIAAALATTILVTMLIKKIENHTKKTIILLNSAVVLAFINTFSMAIMLFPESAFFTAVGFIFTASAVYFADKAKLKYSLLSLLCLIIALGTYQAYLGMFFAFAAISGWLSYLQNSDKRRLFTHWGTIVACSAIAIIFQLIFMQVTKSVITELGWLETVEYPFATTSITIPGILNNIKDIVLGQPRIIRLALGFNFWPIFALMILALLVILAFSISKQKPKDIALFCIAFLAAFIGVFAPHLIAETLYMPIRSIFCYWAFIVCFLMIPCIYFSNQLKPTTIKPKRFQNTARLVYIPVIVLLMLNALVIQDMALDNYTVNQADLSTAKDINARILDYQQDTGNTVTEIAIKNDPDSSKMFQGQNRNQGYEIDVSAFNATPLQTVAFISIVGDNTFKLAEMQDIDYQKLFGNTDWTELNLNEQLVFDGQVAYLAIY